MTRRKKAVLILSAVLLAALVLCTFLSQSVYQLMLPEVTLAKVSMTTVTRTAHTAGTMEALQQQVVRAGRDWTVLEVLAENGQSVSAGTPVLKVDARAFQVEEKQLLLERKTLENTSVWNKADRESKQTQLEILDLRLSLLRSELPEDGIVTAPADGVISGLTAVAGQTLRAGEQAFCLTPRNTKYRIRVTLPMDEGAEFRGGAKASAAVEVPTVDRVEKKLAMTTERMPCEILSSTLDAEGRWHYVLQPESIPDGVVAGQAAQVTLSNSSVTYNAVVPAEAVIDQMDGTYAVYVAETKEGLFGPELVVTKQPVTIEVTNGLQTAVTGAVYAGQEVVTSTTSPLSGGDSVRVDLS